MDATTYDRQQEFWDRFPVNTYPEMVEAIKTVDDVEFRSELIKTLCNYVIDSYVSGGWRYKEDCIFTSDDAVTAYIDLVKYIQPNDGLVYYESVAAMFLKNRDKCLEKLKIFLGEVNDDAIDEEWIAFNLLIFKNAVNGLWTVVSDVLRTKKLECGVLPLIKAIELYYCSDSDNEITAAFDDVLKVAPDSTLIKEWYVKYYENMKMWNNAIACLECLDITYTYDQADRWFRLGWCYGKVRSNKDEAEAYRKCLECDPDYPYARNNLGYAYEKLRVYDKALKIYKECIDRSVDLDYACSNYASILITLGEYKKARAFIKKSPYRVRKRIVDRLDAAERGEVKNVKSVDESPVPQSRIVQCERNVSQFSSEKLLEDELELRMQNGSDVFGVPLKIYRRKGVYGRQLIVPVGRLDLLCEDDSGNLYVIELKKDSGYDDAYAQICSYIDWLEKSDYAQGKNVYGIICLSAPEQRLVDAVHADERVKLFEYHISYTEI